MSGFDRAERAAQLTLAAFYEVEASGRKWSGHGICFLCGCKDKRGGRDRIHARRDQCHPLEPAP